MKRRKRRGKEEEEEEEEAAAAEEKEKCKDEEENGEDEDDDDDFTPDVRAAAVWGFDQKFALFLDFLQQKRISFLSLFFFLHDSFLLFLFYNKYFTSEMKTKYIS